MAVAVHVTHEAIEKIGGIGAVIHGLSTASPYSKEFPTTLLYTPLFNREGDSSSRLGENSSIIFSSIDGIDAEGYGEKLSAIERRFGVRIVYGKKQFSKDGSFMNPVTVDIAAVDVVDMNSELIDEFKFKIWERFGIESNRYKDDADYEQYLRIALPLTDIIEALYGKRERAVLFSHEYMGMPSALALEIERADGKRKGDVTIFYAHEVSTARMIVEKHPGHDFTFYNLMSRDRANGVSLEERFGSYSHSPRNELIKRAVHLDYIFAVSDVVKEEYLYLQPTADESKIEVVYNGINAQGVTYEAKRQGHAGLCGYCQALFSFSPDYVFTHVARLVVSKAMWRDVRLLYFLDEYLSDIGKKGFFVLLSTLAASGRSREEAIAMESDYGWPVLHREGWPDLIGQEVDIYNQLQMFNSRSRAIKGVYLNQYGFEQGLCGTRMPADVSFFSLRLASDVEFGMSIYEPFGIAQLETLPYGGVPLVTGVCGCASLLAHKIDESDYAIVDSTRVPEHLAKTLATEDDFLSISKAIRDDVETDMCRNAIPRLVPFLSNTERERKRRFVRLQSEARLLDWEHVAAQVVELYRAKIG